MQNICRTYKTLRIKLEESYIFQFLDKNLELIILFEIEIAKK